MPSSSAHDGNGQNSALPSIKELLLDAAQRSPDAAYIRHNQAQITFSEVLPLLFDIASQSLLHEGQRAVILLPDSLETALIHLACMFQRAIMIPLSPLSASVHVRYVVDRVNPDIVFTTPILHSKFAAILENMTVVKVSSGNPISLRLENPSSDIESPRSSDVRSIFFTSGTTGEPKGVCLSEGNLLSAARINGSILQLDSSRRSLLMVPLYDYYGAIQLASHLMAAASCTVGASGQFPGSAIELIQSHAVTDLVLVPFTLRTMLDYVEKSTREEYRLAWSKIAHMASSSDKLTIEILQRAFAFNHHLTVVNVYGLTEAGRACYRVIRENTLPENSIGLPSPGMNVRVDAPPGESGELVIAGPTVMMGYLKGVVDDQISLNSVEEVRTADEGYVDEGGEIHLIGRKDHLISIYGMKLHPAEIEIPVNRIHGVEDSLARVSEDAHGRKIIILDVIADEESVTKDRIVDLLRDRVPRPFLPQAINFVDSIPRTEIGGKLVRNRA
jgi:acyl-CoA synthetase (AMP-forming)/AMP-acid ligase II